MIVVTAPVWIWASDKGSWHFLTIPPEQAVEIKLETMGTRRGFGSVRVVARIGEVEWRTSIFPQAQPGGYILPLKAEVRRRAGIAAGEEVTVTLDIIDRN